MFLHNDSSAPNIDLVSIALGARARLRLHGRRLSSTLLRALGSPASSLLRYRRRTGGVPNTLHDCDDAAHYVKSGVGFLADVATHKMTFSYVSWGAAGLELRYS